MEYKTIKKVEVVSFAQAIGAVFAVLGFFISIPMFFFMVVPDTGPATRFEALGRILLIMVVYPLMLFVISFIISGIMAA